ncbi:MAG: ABC transporter permease subunit [Hydrococcus sp. RM1_1_31]|nr:ABC transporter permease subunit [Hydrococcus sp. RM1_1_31]
MTNNEKIPFWRDDRILKIVIQVVVVAVVVTIFAILGSNLARNFQRLRLNFDLGFLFDPDRPASFSIGDSPISFSATDPYNRAILVGLLNSLRVMISGIVLATILGITVGISRLSDNWLVRQIATIYIEIFRNTPLLLQLFFWYSVVFLRSAENE